MRVISGKSRGLKLVAPPGLDTRPTTDRVKESLFNLIMPYLPAENVLDLFAGSGALGIEALSRYSGSATFLESRREAYLIVKKNLELSGQSENATVLFSDAFAFLESTKQKFDLIFLDPPYNQGMLTKAIELISKNHLLAENGISAVEGEVGKEAPPGGLFETLKYAKYGKTAIYILTNPQSTGR